MSKLRIRLIRMIVEAMAKDGVEVRIKPEDLWPATGHYRTSKYSTADPWQGRCEERVGEIWIQRNLDGGDTMTAIVKAGVDWSKSDHDFDIYARDYHVKTDEQ